MNRERFRAMVVRETAEGQFRRQIEDRMLDDLPDGEVLVRVHYSSLNYKDALSAMQDLLDAINNSNLDTPLPEWIACG